MATPITHFVTVNRRSLEAKPIVVTVANNPAVIDSWLIDNINPNIARYVGFDVKWRPGYGETNLLQLCVGTNCIIIQLKHLSEVPSSLEKFLRNTHHIFVGVDIAKKVENLRKEKGICFSYLCDVIDLAMKRWPYQFRSVTNLKDLALVADGIVIPELMNPTYCDWRSNVLQREQIEVAACEAYALYKIGERLYNDEEYVRRSFGSLHR